MKGKRETAGKRLSRRDFISGAAVAAAGFTIVPRHVLGGAGFTPPSDKLNIAGIGFGNQGHRDLENCSGENIVALCDVDQEYARKTFRKYRKAKKHVDFRKMLEKQKDIDAVVIATPDHTHALIAMMAIKMGKHVYCEKPLTHTIYECRKLAAAAREANVATQMGNQGHSGEGVRLMCEWIWDGAIGPVREVQICSDVPGPPSRWASGYGWPQGIDRPKDTPPVPSGLNWDLWLGPAPYRPYHRAYLRKKWRGWFDFGTGGLGDWGCHLMDPVFSALKLGYPTSIEAGSTEVNSETYPLASIVHYKFPARGDMPPLRMTWYDGGMKPPRPEELEPERRVDPVVFIGDKGKLMCGGYGDNPRLIPETKMKEYRRPPKTLPRVNGTHEQNWIDACKGGEPACSNFDYASRLTEIVLLGNVAIRSGQKIYWDGPNMEVTNLPDANKYLHSEYRQGWTL